MLTNAIAKSSVRSDLEILKKGVAQSLERPAFTNLDDIIFKRGFVYKTHSSPPTKIKNRYVKFIYIYSDPYDVVASLYRKNEMTDGEWIRKHSSNFGKKVNSVEEAIRGDKIGIKKNYLKWSRLSENKLAMVKMDYLWEKIDKLSDFVGFDVSLPPKRERNSNKKSLPKKLEKIMLEEYKNVREEMKKMDPIMIQSS
jgi:hypothetical protein